MLVFGGIDEAGYGPMLGPLCVGCAVFVLDEADPGDGPPNLWQRLASAVCRKSSDKKKRIAVDDSKNLKGAANGAAHPIRHLERGVMSFRPCASDEAAPESDAEIFAQLCTKVPQQPWFESRSQLPVGLTPGELRIARGRVQRAMARERIICPMLRCEAVDAADLNRQAHTLSNKADVNFRTAASLIDAIWTQWPHDHPRVMVDRHGGRTRYADILAAAFPKASVETVAETPTMSRYVLDRAGSKITISFLLGGDAKIFPIALASMTAKFTRELFMVRFNRFFAQHHPELKPTAGYFQDARRYVKEIEPVIASLRIEREHLIRAV